MPIKRRNPLDSIPRQAARRVHVRIAWLLEERTGPCPKALPVRE